ncbi:MAG: ATP-binding protein [Deltaproteobacteria bacterium]|nr:ATP-binding protein [Deltaproteobacteria bacterium]
MNSLRSLCNRSNSYHGRITLVFILLAAILEGILVTYWLFALEPRLRAEASAYSQALSTAQAQLLAFEIAERDGRLRQEKLNLAMDKILLFRVPQSEKPFTKKISLELDYDVVTATAGSLDFSRGDKEPSNCDTLAIPLFSPTSRELLGIAHFSNNLAVIGNLESEIRTKLTLASILIILLLIIVWLTISSLNTRLSNYAGDLARAKELAGKTIAALQDSRIMLNPTGHITEANPYAANLLGYQQTELVGRHLSTFLKESSLFEGRHLENFIIEKTLANTELHFITKNGTLVEMMFSAAMVLDPEGNFNGIICFGKDITSLNQAKRAVEEKQTQMIHAGRLSALGEMATGIAHELSQPLYIIRLAADALHDYFDRNATNAIEATDTAKIIGQVERATTILNNMRSFGRAETGEMELLNISRPLHLALSFFREQFRKNNLRLQEEIDMHLPRVKANAQKFEQIVINLLSNGRYAVIARQKRQGEGYTPTVIIRLYQDEHDGRLVFEVEDNGIGMSPQELDRCLEPFFTSKEVGQGTGLGLSIAHGLIKEMAMELVVGTTQGKGSLFRLFMTPASMS